jgi:hypothetical protein
MPWETVMSTAVSPPPLPTARAVRWLYLTVFASIAALGWVIQCEGVVFLVALPVASGVAIVAVSLVKVLLATNWGTPTSAPSRRLSPSDVPPQRR